MVGYQREVLGQVSAGLDYTNRPTAGATKIDVVPTMDGEVINDPLWESIEPIQDLLQTQPNFGESATEKTEIRIAYSSTVFYLSVVCYDSQPQNLVISDARRDAALDNTDSFLFILDTYNDGQNGFVFGTNSMGVEYDAQVDNEGQGNFNANRQQGGVIGGFNLNWDASWEVKSKVGDFGWSAEFAIPLKSIRYNSGTDQIWGINFRRNIRKTNEIDYWSPIPIGFDIKRLSLAGKLTGLDLKNQGNLKMIPYGLVQVSKDWEKYPPLTEQKADAGVDLKYSITPSLTLDLTYNTDFAQVEVDEQQVNLDRFNLFFPEKRPFFLENAGIFTVGSPGEVDLFFSRKIGIGDGGSVVPILGGARLSGKINKTNIAVLNMFTDDVFEDGIEKNNYAVYRVKHEFKQRSSIGAAMISRTGLGDTPEDYNRTYAVDGKWGFGKKAQVLGFYSKSISPDDSLGNHAFKLQAQYEWNNLNINTGYTEVGESFNPEVGFLLRESFRKPEFLVLYHVRPKDKWGLLELRPHVSYRGYWDFDGFQQTGFLHVDNHWEWKNGIEIHTGINFTTEGVANPFEIASSVIIPDSTFKHSEAQIVVMTNKSKMISLNTRSVVGGYFGGKRYAHSGTINLRFGDKFNSSFTLSRNDYRLPYGNFVTNILSSRISYSFTPRIFTQSLIQYNSVLDLWSANVRFGILKQANSGLFIVYNEIIQGTSTLNRSFIIKYSFLFDVIK